MAVISGVSYIVFVTPFRLDMTLLITTSTHASAPIAIQVNLSSAALAGATWDQTVNPDNLTVETFSFSQADLRVTIPTPAPSTSYLLVLVGLHANPNVAGRWGAGIEAMPSIDVAEVVVWLVQLDTRLGLFLTVDNEWGWIERAAPAVGEGLSGRHFDEVTFLLWSELVAVIFLLVAGIVAWTLSCYHFLRDQEHPWHHRLPLFTTSAIVLTLAVYIAFGGTGLPAPSPYHNQYSSTLSPASIFWQLPPWANLLSSFLHGDYSHVSGNMLGYGMLGVLLMETWMVVPRRYLALCYAAPPAYLTAWGLILGSVNAAGASFSIAATIALGLVWLLAHQPNQGPPAEVTGGTGGWRANLGRCLRWSWMRRNLVAMLLFGYVTVAFLWSWIGLLVQYLQQVALYGVSEARLAQIQSSTMHLRAFAVGIVLAISVLLLTRSKNQAFHQRTRRFKPSRTQQMSAKASGERKSRDGAPAGTPATTPPPPPTAADT